MNLQRVLLQGPVEFWGGDAHQHCWTTENAVTRKPCFFLPPSELRHNL